MPDIASTLSALLDALSQDKRILRQHVADSAPELVRNLVPYQLEGEEHICGGVRYRLQSVSATDALPLKALQGLPIGITIADERGGERAVCGIVCRSEQLVCDGAGTLMQVEFRDGLSLLHGRHNWRPFCDLSVIQITEQILGEHVRANAVLAVAFRWRIEHLYHIHPQRAFTLQAGESDAAFLERLWRCEGIAWHFSFTFDGDKPIHTLVLSDANPVFRREPALPVRFHRADATEDSDTIVAWQAWREQAPGSTQREQYDYKTAQIASVEDHSVLDQGPSGNALAASLSDYHYDPAHLADDHEHQDQLGRRRIEAHEFAAKGYRGEGVTRDFRAGLLFSLSGHPEIDAHPSEAREFIVTHQHVYARNNVRLDPRLAPSLFEGWQYRSPHHSPTEDTAGDPRDTGNAPLYHVRFECVRSHVPIVPAFDPQTVPKLHLLSAVVATQNGQELDVDELGRVPVRFLFGHNDDWQRPPGAPPPALRSTPGGAPNSARIRVMQPWADSGFGTTYWPRNGTEVVIGFVQGHPDKPLVMGSAYSGTHQAARYAGRGSLPANAALTGMRSKELRGDRHNHLRFSDFHGQISTQLTTDHAATQLNQGWLGTPHDNGRSSPRGEGLEGITDAAAAFRAAKGLLLSAFARLNAGGLQLDRQETLAVMQECLTLFTELGHYAAQHEGMAVDTQPHSELQTQLQNWDNGSNTAPDAAGGGAPIIAITAPAGIHHSSPASVVTHAGQNVDTAATGHIQSASGGRTVINAGQGVSTFAQSGGIKTIAHQGDHLLQAQHANVIVQAAIDLLLSASQGKLHLFAHTEVLIGESGGACIRLANGTIELIAPNAHHVKAGQHIWDGPASGSVSLPTFSLGSLGRSPLAVRPTDGAPVADVGWQLARGDGSLLDGQSSGSGQTYVLDTQAFEPMKITLTNPKP
jgi:type VI secretion system secreted protein VgrG